MIEPQAIQGLCTLLSTRTELMLLGNAVLRAGWTAGKATVAEGSLPGCQRLYQSMNLFLTPEQIADSGSSVAAWGLTTYT